jgi:hypothetical protein
LVNEPFLAIAYARPAERRRPDREARKPHKASPSRKVVRWMSNQVVHRLDPVTRHKLQELVRLSSGALDDFEATLEYLESSLSQLAFLRDTADDLLKRLDS